MSRVMGIVVSAVLTLAVIYAYNKFSGSDVSKLGK